jgi:hypothetical protein
MPKAKWCISKKTTTTAFANKIGDRFAQNNQATPISDNYSIGFFSW